jgi:hypothetical protein
MHEPTFDWKKPLKWLSIVAIVGTAVSLYVMRLERHEKLCAEAAELLKEFQVISDPFTRPKLYRHKAAKNLNSTTTTKVGEVLFLATSEGDVRFVKTFATDSIRANTFGDFHKAVSTGATVAFTMDAERLKILVKDLVFEPRLAPCFAKTNANDRYSWVDGWIPQDKDIIERIGQVVADDRGNEPILYRLTQENAEGRIDAAQGQAFKQTFRLAELIRETGK